MYINSNLSPEEQLRYFGAIRPDDLETLLQKELDPDDILPYLQEAMTGFPDEGFLSDPLDELQEFAKRLRGSNRSDLQAIIRRIDQTLLEVHQSAEYGVDELQQAIKLLEGGK